MKGLQITRNSSHGIRIGEGGSAPVLVAQMPNLEISIQRMGKDAIAWLTPDSDSKTIEIYTVLDGKISLETDDGIEELDENDTVYITDLGKEVQIHVLEETRLLYITNQYQYIENTAFQESLDEMMHRLNDKDHYTYQHCLNVMNYSVKILQKLGTDKASMSDLITAALFHDVGKCRILDETLNKDGSYTPREWAEMVKHPVFSSQLLKKDFGDRIAKIALCHHERLDGTGYPSGLRGSQIPYESQIIAVADSFDAMTSVRVYQKKPKKYTVAVEELCRLTDKYDAAAANALRELVLEGAIEKKNPDN